MTNRLEAVRLLVVDDDLDTLELLGVITKFEGAEVVMSSSAAGALAAVAGGFVPDLLIVDFAMPLTDGFQFLEAFEKLHVGVRRERTPVIVASAHDERGWDTRVDRMGYSLLRKPLSGEELVERIAALLTKP